MRSWPFELVTSLTISQLHRCPSLSLLPWFRGGRILSRGFTPTLEVSTYGSASGTVLLTFFLYRWYKRGQSSPFIIRK